MFPVILQFGQFAINSYGFLIALGFYSAIYVIEKLAHNANLNSKQIENFAFKCFVIGLLGARLAHILVETDLSLASFLGFFKVWEGGLMFYGGPIAALPYAFWFIRKHKLPLWKVLDILAPPLALGHGFGRLGCLAAGCCYGKPTGSSFGITFHSDIVEESMRGIPLHPTQFYEAISLFLLFFGLLYLQKHKRFNGQVALTYLLVYPIIRSVVEIYRGDLARGFVIGDSISTGQFVSFLVFASAGFVLFNRRQIVSAP
jgi:phosphatidylglycerol---prolipoprotein diacylglyceryl transferase